MLSKEMYDLLKQIPRYPQSIFAGKLYENSPMASRIKDLLLEASHADYEYVNCSNLKVLDSEISRTEKGQALVEEYEAAERNQKIVDESLKISQESLKVARVAKWAANFSAVASLPTLIGALTCLVEKLNQLFLSVQ